jgi:very-short-patch-repair endonuclease
MKKQDNNVLVALIKTESDFKIAQKRHWYRIPVKSAPPIVRNYELKYIAFYHNRNFEKEKFSVRWYSKVTKMIVIKRKYLFPNLINDPKADDFYFKIEFEPLQLLTKPILSLRERFRIVFIPTTEEKLFNSTEINYLFNDSYLEEKLWKELIGKEIYPERQFYVKVNNHKYVLDFAIFCKTRNIDIECDGDNFHTGIKHEEADNRRNNFLTSAGWSVLRFATVQIEYEMLGTMNLINEAINNFGGIQDLNNNNVYRYIKLDNDKQMDLFE